MSYLIVNTEHQVILGTTDAPYASFTNQFVECTDAQIAMYERMQSILPDDHYVQLSDVITPAAEHKQTKQRTPEQNAARKASIDWIVKAIHRRH